MAADAESPDPLWRERLAARLAALQPQLPPSVHLLAVSKGQPAAAIRAAAGLGLRHFGESRLQEAVPKQAELADLDALDWHFIGRLQANKVRGVLRHFGTLHSIDSLALARRVQRIAAEEGCRPRLLFQVKLRPDPAKAGFTPEQLLRAREELRDLAPAAAVGLMTIAPQGLTPAERGALFGDCAALARDLALPELSMGMSDDWPEAVAAGSTWIRLGTGLFGLRPVAG
jgi:pyridoxal phosphate enzyme (YggS family)